MARWMSLCFDSVKKGRTGRQFPGTRAKERMTSLINERQVKRRENGGVITWKREKNLPHVNGGEGSYADERYGVEPYVH